MKPNSASSSDAARTACRARRHGSTFSASRASTTSRRNNLQKKESQYTRCKGFDTFAPIGPCIARGLTDEARTVEGWVNTERRQASSTRFLIFPIELLVEFVTFVMTLEPGDIIATGTPEGIGPIHAGDTVTVKVEGVGELKNPVQDE